MAGIKDLLIRLRIVRTGAEEIDKTQRALGNLERYVKGFLTFQALERGLRETIEAVKAWGELESISTTFRHLVEATGTNGEALLRELERVNNGLLTQAELMRIANLTMQANVPELTAALPKLLEVAKAAALAAGQDLYWTYDSLVRGIMRASPLLIDNANIFLRVSKSIHDYAAALGKGVEELTIAERQTALLQAVLADADRMIESSGVSAELAAVKLAALRTAWQEFRQEMGRGLWEAGGEAITEWLTRTLRGIMEAQQATRALREHVMAMRDAFREAGMAAEAAQAEMILHNVHLKDYAQASGLLDELSRKYSELTWKTEALKLATAGLVEMMEKWQDVAMAAADAMSITTPDVLSLRSRFMAYRRWREAEYEADLKVTELRRRIMAEQLRHQRQYEEERRRAAEEAAAEAERLAQEHLQRMQSIWEQTRMQAESVLRVRMEPTPLDFWLTALGQYENAPLEAVRRLDAILARGFAELEAHPDWISLLRIPDDVLTSGELALRIWAQRTRDAVANLTRPDLIDWDAFVREFRAMREAEAARQLTLDLAMQKLIEAGLVSPATAAAARSQVVRMLGLDTPEDIGAQMATGFQQAFAMADPAGRFAQSMQKRLEEQKSVFQEFGRKVGLWFGDAIRESAVLAMDSFLPELARRLLPHLSSALSQQPLP